MNINKLKTYIDNPKQSAWILTGIMILAGVIRYKIIFEYNLIPGLNGGYYPVQVRSFLENFKLGFPDFPLLFWIEATIAGIYNMTGIFESSRGIMIASKLTDTIFPILSVVPVYHFIRDFGAKNFKTLLPGYIIAAFAVLYFSPVFLLTADVQKNAMGNVWVFCVLLFSYRYISYFRLMDLVYLALFVVLCFLTHITSTGFVILFMSIYIPLAIVLSNKNRLVIFKGIGILFVLFIFLLLWMRVSDPVRFDKILIFISEPLKVFANPYLLYFIKGFPVMHGLILFNFILMNALTLLCSILILINWRHFTGGDRIFSIAVLVCAFFITTPLLGYGWERLYMIAYIPVTILLAIVLKTNQYKLISRTITILIVFIIGFSIYVTFAFDKRPSITREAYNELFAIRKLPVLSQNSLVIGQHGLEWWTAWALECDVGQPFSLTGDDFNRYDHVFYIYQVKGWNYFNVDQGRKVFSELQRNQNCVFFGTFFNLYRLKVEDIESYIFDMPPNLSGRVIRVAEHEITVRDQISVHNVEVNNNVIQMLKRANEVNENVMVNVWGKRKPFSMKIKADSIQHYYRVR